MNNITPAESPSHLDLGEGFQDQVEMAEALTRQLTVDYLDGQIQRQHQRAAHLVVARESARGDMVLLENMIRQTLDRYGTQIPDYRELRRLGADPVRTDPKTFQNTLDDIGILDKHVMVCGGSRAVLFKVGSTWALYSQGSAAKEDAPSRENGFNVILRDVLERLRPENVYLSTFSRLVRSVTFAGLMHRAVQQNVDTLYCGEMALRSADPMAIMFFNLMAVFASMERNSVVMRLVLGTVARHEKGYWQWGAKSLPMGYFLDGGRVEFDPYGLFAVRRMIRLLGTPGLSATEILEQLAELISPASSRQDAWSYGSFGGMVPSPDDPDVPVPYDTVYSEEQLRLPKRATGKPISHRHGLWAMVRRWYDLLDVYENGVYSTIWRNALPGVRAYGSLQVQNPDQGGGFIKFENKMPLPEGGWATPLEFARARAMREQLEQRRMARGTTSSRVLLPLVGRKWNDFSPTGNEDVGVVGRESILMSQPSNKGGNTVSFYVVRTRDLIFDSRSQIMGDAFEDGEPYDEDTEAELAEAAWAEEMTSAQGPLTGSLSSSATDSSIPLAAREPDDHWLDDGAEDALEDPEDADDESFAFDDDSGQSIIVDNRRRPWTDQRGRPDGIRIARIKAADLHRSIAVETAKALREGIEGRMASGPTLRLMFDPATAEGDASQAEVREHLIAEITAAQDFADALLKERLAESDPDARAHMAEAHRSKLVALRKLKGRLADGDAAASALPTSLRGDASVFLATLGALGRADGPVDRRIAEALDVVLVDLTVEVPDDLTVVWGAKLILPTDRGRLQLGPVSGTVRQEWGRIADLSPKIHASRLQAVVERLMTDDELPKGLLNNQVLSQRRRIEATKELAERGLGTLAGAALTCPFPGLRRTLWGELTNSDVEAPWGHADFREHLRRTYLDPDERSWPLSTWRMDSANLQHFLLDLASRGDSVDYPEAISLAAEYGLAGDRDSFARRFVWASPTGEPGLLDWAPNSCPNDCFSRGRRSCQKHSRVQLRACPHPGCDGRLSRTIRVPECPARLLCPTCQRMPLPDSPRFPDEYFEAWVDPYESRDEVDGLHAGRRADPGAAIRAWAVATGRPLPGARARVPYELRREWSELALAEREPFIQQVQLKPFAAAAARTMTSPELALDLMEHPTGHTLFRTIRTIENRAIKSWAQQQGLSTDLKASGRSETVARWAELPEDERELFPDYLAAKVKIAAFWLSNSGPGAADGLTDDAMIAIWEEAGRPWSVPFGSARSEQNNKELALVEKHQRQIATINEKLHNRRQHGLQAFAKANGYAGRGRPTKAIRARWDALRPEEQELWNKKANPPHKQSAASPGPKNPKVKSRPRQHSPERQRQALEMFEQLRPSATSDDATIKIVATKTGINTTSIYNWIRAARGGPACPPVRPAWTREMWEPTDEQATQASRS